MTLLGLIIALVVICVALWANAVYMPHVVPKTVIAIVLVLLLVVICLRLVGVDVPLGVRVD